MSDSLYKKIAKSWEKAKNKRDKHRKVPSVRPIGPPPPMPRFVRPINPIPPPPPVDSLSSAERSIGAAERNTKIRLWQLIVGIIAVLLAIIPAIISFLK